MTNGVEMDTGTLRDMKIGKNDAATKKGSLGRKIPVSGSQAKEYRCFYTSVKLESAQGSVTLEQKSLLSMEWMCEQVFARSLPI